MRTALSLAALFVLAASAAAAPLPEAPPLNDKYLLDDADCVIVVNVKQVLASPVFKKSFDKLIGDFLKDEKVASVLKDGGFDPLKDVERVTLIMARSCWTTGKGSNGGPVLLVQGRFDAAKLQTLGKKFAKSSSEYGGTTIYELAQAGSPQYAAVLDKNHVMLAPQKALVETALDKAAAKKKTDLKNKTLAALFAKIKPEQPLTAIATGNTVMGVSGIATRKPDGTFEEKWTIRTLGDSGVELLQAVVDAKDTIRGKVTLTTKNADKAREMEAAMKEGLKRGITEIEKEKGFDNLAKAMKAVKLAAKDDTITIEVEGDGEAAREFFVAMFSMRGPATTKPKVEPKGDSIKRADK